MSQLTPDKTRYQLSAYRQKEQEEYDKQPATFSCAFCKWTAKGSVAECKEKSLAHREKKHPETFLIRRRRRSGRALTTFRYTTMDAQSIQEIETDRKKRAFLNGVELEA